MLYPALPPDSSPVPEYIQPATDLSSTSVVEDETRKQQLVIPGNTETWNGVTTSSQDHQNDLVVAKPLSSSAVPETVPPEFSPRNVSDDLKGKPLKITSTVTDSQPKTDVENISTTRLPKISDQVINTKKLLLSQSPVVIPTDVVKTSVPGNKQNTVTVEKSGSKINIVASPQPEANTPSSLLVQNIIEFKLRNPSNQKSTPQIIELSPPKQSPGKTAQVRQRTVEVIADRQEYDEQRRIVTATGNVVVRFDGAVVDADRLQVNLDNLIVVGEGNVALTRGNQVLRGEKFNYNFVQDSGNLQNGSGEIYIPTTQTDLAFSPSPTANVTAGGVPRRLPSYRIRANQPITGVTSPGGINLTLSGQSDARNIPGSKSGGIVKRLRFEAQKIDFYPRGWQAEDVRITNDPFSPPELELRASKVNLTREAPLIDRITTQRQRLVFDQNFNLPIPINNRKIDRRERQVNPFIVSPGFDNGRRGGLFVERNFSAVNTDKTRWSLTPQFFLQKAVQGSSNITELFGVKTKLSSVLGVKTTVEGKAELTSLNFNQVEDNLRGSLRLRQALGTVNPHILNVEYSYRDRLYNGTLGFQTVQSSLGGVITSPIIPLGKTGINLSYQAGAQFINANTDRQDLLNSQRNNDRISLGRFQGSISLNTGFFLWQGKPLPATATQGLKYAPNPIVPYLQAIAGVTGTTSYYSNGDNQSTLTGTIGLVGQVGNFSRQFLDYTAFNIVYSQGLNSGLSPFLFDRSVDNRVLSAGISQQIYGPFRLGLQTSINLDTGQESSTDYVLEYNRRTYGITLRYNPVLELGGFSIRISDFNWRGGTDPFSDGEITPVVNGVRQDN